MATEYGNRLKMARKHAELTQIEAWKLTGIPQSTISTAEREGHGSSDTPIYAKAYGVDAHWLATGEGEMLPSHDTTRKSDNVSLGPNIRGQGRYPVLSEVQAGNWREVCGDASATEEWGVSHHNLGQCGYMLRVVGDSMTNTETGARFSFPEGMLLHVNPHVEPIAGKFVVVRRESDKAVTFKRLKLVDGDMYLEAINPNWPKRFIKMEPGDVFCGVVVDASFGNLP